MYLQGVDMKTDVSSCIFLSVAEIVYLVLYLHYVYILYPLYSHSGPLHLTGVVCYISFLTQGARRSYKDSSE